ncbi:MAG: STAS domain-containing protein [Candidatus Acidiferrales bacterium]
MTLKIAVRDVGEVKILELDGRLVLGEDSKSFRERIKMLLQAGEKKIILNLSNLSYIDSSGIAMLVASCQTARSHGVRLKLANVGPKINEVMTMTKLTPVFDIFDSEAAAIGSFT